MPYNGSGKEHRPVWERFWEKVDKRGPDECWEWLARKCPLGYGRLWVAPNVRLAHHVSCMLHGIPIPGYPKSENVIDHKCGNRGCVNPAHLRIVAQVDNCGILARPTPHWNNKKKTHCANGHPLSGSNLAIYPSNGKPSRTCLTCEPSRWMWAVEPRDPPPNARVKAWRGPFRKDGNEQRA